jgi:hypothetical protein
MPKFRSPHLSRRLLLFFLAVSAGAHPERLPIKAYTTADGLPHNTVMRIVRDSHGFLWFLHFGGTSAV